MTIFQEESKKMVEDKIQELTKRDWNKDWPSARREAPKNCSCGKKLEKPKIESKTLIKPCKEIPDGVIQSTGKWRIDCKCGITYLWSYPNVWIRTHRLLEFCMFINGDGSLLKPAE